MEIKEWENYKMRLMLTIIMEHDQQQKLLILLIIWDSVFTRNMATKNRQCQYGRQSRKKMDVGKNTYNCVETYNYLNMKQNDGITFCTQLSLFFLKNLLIIQKHHMFIQDAINILYKSNISSFLKFLLKFFISLVIEFIIP